MPHPPLPALSRWTALLLTVSLLTVSLLTACQASPEASVPPSAESLSPPSPNHTEESLRAYYEALIAELNQALLEARQEDYITRKDYEKRIAELESRLEALQSPADPPDEATDIPVSSSPTPSDDPASLDPSSAFSYTVENGSAVIRAYRGAQSQVTIPATLGGYPVARIADDAFRATLVTTVTLPDTVTEIGWFAFADCKSLAAVTLPDTVTEIGYGAFENCPRLTVLCSADSYAAAYAQSFALPFAEPDE